MCFEVRNETTSLQNLKHNLRKRIADQRLTGAGLVLIALGLPLYYYFRRRSRRQSPCDHP